jgi:hypothetical protein
MTLQRSGIEFAKRVFLDRLTTQDQAISQPHEINMINEGPGDPYIYGGCYDPFNFGIGADCSGCVGIMTAAVFNGTKMGWQRYFSTETFPGPFQGFRQTSQDDLVNNDHVMKVCICHGGGGPNSHMNCTVDGWVMESNGDYGTCTLNHGAIPEDSSYWNDFWVLDDTINEDIIRRQPMGYPLGVDYAGGRIAAADLRSNGVVFACRYLTDGGPGLPGKQLQPDEFTDLVTHGINVVFNHETTADMMLGGQSQGVADATANLAYLRSFPNMAAANPVIYYSCDFDEAPNQQDAINGYLSGAASVLGGPQYVGIYGGYWPLSRALDAGVCKYAWQTEAWSGGNIDSRVNIVQRNGLGYLTVDGVQCDQNQAHSDDYGHWNYAPSPSPLPQPVPVTPIPPPPRTSQDLFNLVVSELTDPQATPIIAPDGSVQTLRQAIAAIYWKETTLLGLDGRPVDPKHADDQLGHTLSARAEQLKTQALVCEIATKFGINVQTIFNAAEASFNV